MRDLVPAESRISSRLNPEVAKLRKPTRDSTHHKNMWHLVMFKAMMASGRRDGYSPRAPVRVSTVAMGTVRG
jgi:hypothetical protein